MLCILKSMLDVKVIRELYEGNYIELNVFDLVGKFDDRVEERILEKKYEIFELCLVLEFLIFFDIERYGYVSFFIYDRCCVKFLLSNMIGLNVKGKVRLKVN